MAYFHMDGEALVWFEDDEDTRLFVSWDAFVQALQVKFGTTACDNQNHPFLWVIQCSFALAKFMFHQMNLFM